MKTFKEYQADLNNIEYIGDYDGYEDYRDEECMAVDGIYQLTSLPDDRFEKAFDALSKDQFTLLLDIYYEYQMSRNH